MLTYRQLSTILWGGDYKLLVKDALDSDPEMAATIRTRLESAPGHYKRRLKAAGDTAALMSYEEKEEYRIAILLSELDGACSQKCRTPFKEAKGIQAKIQRMGVAAAGAASYEGDNLIVTIPLAAIPCCFCITSLPSTSMAVSVDVLP